MASSSVVVSTSISVLISPTTSFSTIYQTSKPIVVATLTSTATQLATLTQPEVVMTSTLAYPTTISQTISRVLTSYAAVPPPISATPSSGASTEIITSTSTVTSTIVQPGQPITYYPPSHTFVLTPPPTYTVVGPTMTVTLTELIFLLENPSGEVYTTITTAIPVQATPTGPVVLVAGGDRGTGWATWSDAQKGGLVAGVVLLILILVGLLAFLLLRRRNIWLASEWAGPPEPVVVQPQMAGAVVPYQQAGQGQGQGYWGYGPAGWGIRN